MKNIRKNIKIFLLQFLLKKMTKMENRLILLYFLSTKTDPKTSLALIKIKIHGFSFHVKTSEYEVVILRSTTLSLDQYKREVVVLSSLS